MVLKNRYLTIILILTMLFPSIWSATASTSSTPSKLGATNAFLDGASTGLSVIDVFLEYPDVINAFVQATGSSFLINTKNFKQVFEEKMAESGNSLQETFEKVKNFAIAVGDIIFSIGNDLFMAPMLIQGNPQASLADAYQALADAYKVELAQNEIGTPLLPPPTSDTSSNEGSGVSDIGKPLIGYNSPKTEASTQAQFPHVHR